MSGRTVAAAILLAVGSTQMIGYVLGSKALRGLGAALCMSPCPKVFADVDGLETFASRFTIAYETTEAGAPVRHEMTITPELYSKLSGPYNRRNVYGAALSYAPRLPEPLWRAVFDRAFRPGDSLREELGLPADATRIEVVIETQTRGRHDRWVLR